MMFDVDSNTHALMSWPAMIGNLAGVPDQTR
jgi:hypothetical protein